jgi:predicted ATP-dependent protease
VIIPQSNVKNLMLREDVIEAVKEGKFHLWAVTTIDEGIELLTGQSAGERQEDGTFLEDTVNERVSSRLERFEDTMKQSRIPENGN